MPTETTEKLFTVDEYYKMAEVGILKPQDRVELIAGKIIQMSPIGTLHAGRVLALAHKFALAFGERAFVSSQGPLRLSDYTEPQPDIVLLKPRDDLYCGKRMMAGDALLVAEVSDTTLAYDRDVKLPRYAASGIPEVWIEDLQDSILLVYRNPINGAYTTVLSLTRQDSVSVQAFPDVVFKVADLIG